MSKLIIEGVVKGWTPVEKIEGQNGLIYKCNVLVEQGGQYPKIAAVTFMNDKINEMGKFPVGSYVAIHVNIDSREYNSKWYHNVNGWKIESAQAATHGAPAAQAAPAAPGGYAQPAAAPAPTPAAAPAGVPIGTQQNGFIFNGQGWEPATPDAISRITGNRFAAPAPAAAPTTAPAGPQFAAPAPTAAPTPQANNGSWNPEDIPF